MTDLWDNPAGTDGFEFVEYTAPDPAALGQLFESMGFQAVARHRSKDVTLYRQGDVNFIINAEPGSFAQAFARVHGPSVCAIAFRVKDAAQAYQTSCYACHGTGQAHAPIVGEVIEWEIRAEKGLDVLLQNTINGLNGIMPARGLCMDCSDDNLKAIVEYMLEQSK